MNTENNGFSICPGCGLVYSCDSDVKACHINSCGASLRQSPEDAYAAIANALDYLGYTVNRFIFPSEYNSAREISIEFVNQCDFTLNPPPDGFTYERGTNVVEGLNLDDGVPEQARYIKSHETPSYVYKRYPADMPPEKYARQLIADKYALIEWIYRHPYMRDKD